MADGSTTNLSFVLPEVGFSDDTWGGKLNANWSQLDGYFAGGGATILHERGGLEADVSAYSGLIKISGGATSQAAAGTDYYAPGSTDVAVADGGTGASDAGTARTNLGLAIGTNVQAYDADLTSWAAITRAAGFDTFVATPSSANLASLVTGETGSGALVFGTSPTIGNPTITTPTISAPVCNTPASANWTGTESLDPANGDIQDISLTGNVTTLTDNMADGESVVLQINDGTAYTITWPTITWVSGGGTAPTLQTTGDTIIGIWKNGTTLFGNALNGA